METILIVYLAGSLCAAGIYLADPPPGDKVGMGLLCLFGSWLIVGMAIGILMNNLRVVSKH